MNTMARYRLRRQTASFHGIQMIDCPIEMKRRERSPFSPHGDNHAHREGTPAREPAAAHVEGIPESPPPPISPSHMVESPICLVTIIDLYIGKECRVSLNGSCPCVTTKVCS